MVEVLDDTVLLGRVQHSGEVLDTAFLAVYLELTGVEFAALIIAERMQPATLLCLGERLDLLEARKGLVLLLECLQPCVYAIVINH